MNAARLYHFDGTRCHDPASCWDRPHTRVPSRCDVQPLDDSAGHPAGCDLPHGHPGPHIHADTGWQYTA
jgi:hypothetical protein